MLIEDTFIQSKLKLPLPFKNLHKMGKEVKIVIPDDCDIFATGTGKLEVRKIEKKLPKTWEEFCKTHPIEGDKDCYISAIGDIIIELPDSGRTTLRHPISHRTDLPNIETAEAFLALMQLIQLRDCYNDGWKPDWKNADEGKWVIVPYRDELEPFNNEVTCRVLAFKSEDLRDQFLENFRDLIEIAKPLI